VEDFIKFGRVRDLQPGRLGTKDKSSFPVASLLIGSRLFACYGVLGRGVSSPSGSSTKLINRMRKLPVLWGDSLVGQKNGLSSIAWAGLISQKSSSPYSKTVISLLGFRKRCCRAFSWLQAFASVHWS